MITKATPDSSQILSIGYDKEQKIFEVIYKGKTNSTYHYYSVVESLWEDAQKAESIGKFVSTYIKPHQYKKVA